MAGKSVEGKIGNLLGAFYKECTSKLRKVESSDEKIDTYFKIKDAYVREFYSLIKKGKE